MDYTSLTLSYYEEGQATAPILIDAEEPSRCIFSVDYVTAVKRIAVGLPSLGFEEQDGVGLLSYNDIYYYVLGDGVVAAGGSFSGIPTFVKRVELSTAIKAAGLKWLFVGPEFLDLALETVQSMGLPPSMVAVYDPPGRGVYVGPQACLSKLMADADEAHFQNANLGKDPETQHAFRMFTSGSTGSVKAAIFSHRAAVARTSSMAASRVAASRVLLHIGMYHVSGLMLHGQAVVGKMGVYVSRASTAAAFMDRVASLKIQSTMVTPHMMEDITVDTDARDKLSTLDLAAFSGAPCRQELAEQFRKLLPSKAAMITAYGSTEVSPLVHLVVADDWKTGQVGFTAGATEVKICDPETFEEVPPGGVGEICARSDCCFSGYYNNEAATRDSFIPNAPEWFRTGDKGSMDPETKMLSILGRYKQIFKVRYEEVSPVEVESELLQHDRVVDALVTSTAARHDEKDRECMAYIVAQSGVQLKAQDVVDFVASRLAAHKAPTGAVVFCDRIPRGAMGKPLNKELSKVIPLEGSAKFLKIAS